MRALSLDVERAEGQDRPVGGPTLAEGIAVKNVGALTEPIVRALVADVLLVEEAHSSAR
jgi:threonine dehydratase